MVEAVVHDFLGSIFVDGDVLEEVVEKGDVDPRGGTDAVAKAAENPQVNLLFGGDLLDGLQEDLLLDVVVGFVDQLYELVNLIEVVKFSLNLSTCSQQTLEGLYRHFVVALCQVGKTGSDHGGLVLKRIAFR